LLQKQLRSLAAKHPAAKLSVGGQPSAPSVSFDLGTQSQAAKQIFVRRMLGRGFLVTGQLYVMYSHTEEQVNAVREALDLVLGEIEELHAAGRLQAEAGSRQPIGQAFARLA
jgi:glutamate-1-semialdehyde 2,1-aminomutase